MTARRAISDLDRLAGELPALVDRELIGLAARVAKRMAETAVVKTGTTRDGWESTGPVIRNLTPYASFSSGQYGERVRGFVRADATVATHLSLSVRRSLRSE